MGNIGSWFSKNEKNKILNDKEIISILDELNIKDAILNDEEITEDNLIQKIFSAIENKYKFNKNTKRKKYTTDIINDLVKFRDEMLKVKNKYIEKNNNLYIFIQSELTKLETIIIDLQKFLGNIPNNAPNNSLNNAATSAATPKAIYAANSASNFPANNAAAAAKKEANNAATAAAATAAAATATAKNEGNLPATSAANAANSAATPAANAANSAATSAANSAATPAATSAANFPNDPDKIFELIEEFEKKFENTFLKIENYTETNKKSKKLIYKKNIKPADNLTREYIEKILKVLLLYKNLFPKSENNENIIKLITKYYTLCVEVDKDCKLGKKLQLSPKSPEKRMYNSTEKSNQYNKLMRNIENKTSTNISLMFKDILPNNNANNKPVNKPVNNPNNKIKQEKIEKIWENIEFIKNTLDTFKYFEFPEKNNKNNIVKTIQQKFLDFIKFLLIFKKIIKNKNETISSKINEFIREYLKRCGTSKDEKDKYPMNTNDETLRERCKSKKTIGDYGRSIYELINFDNQDNVDREFKKLLEIGWNNDEEFNKLKDEFNSMLIYYYAYLTKKQKSVNEEVLIE